MTNAAIAQQTTQIPLIDAFEAQKSCSRAWEVERAVNPRAQVWTWVRPSTGALMAELGLENKPSAKPERVLTGYELFEAHAA